MTRKDYGTPVQCRPGAHKPLTALNPNVETCDVCGHAKLVHDDNGKCYGCAHTVTVTRVGKTPGRYRYRLAFSQLPDRTFGPYGFGEAIRDLTISALLEPIDARNLVLDAAASGSATRAMG